MRNEGASDPFPHRKRESQTNCSHRKRESPIHPKIPLPKIPLAQRITRSCFHIKEKLSEHCDFNAAIFSEAQSWRKRNMTHQCSHERAPASAHASAHASVHESAAKVGFLCAIIPYRGSHSSAHVSAHAGAHASAHGVVWSYVTWSVFTCSVPYPNLVVNVGSDLRTSLRWLV